MKNLFNSILILLFITLTFTDIGLAQDSPQWDLPEGAKARLGKGRIYDIKYSPNGARLAVASGIGIWLYDTQTNEELDLLTGHRGWVRSVSFSPDGYTLASGSDDGTVLLWELAPPEPEPPHLAADVNEDGQTTIADLILVVADYQKTPIVNPRADVNGDGPVDKQDIIIVAEHLGESTDAAPPISFALPEGFTPTMLQQVLNRLRAENDGSLAFQRGIANLERLLASLIPEKTELLFNYPNPFNPETWIPYQLAEAADVTVSIYTVDGELVQTLRLGQQPAGMYASRHRAAYWDGKNALGESVASGVYFYTLRAGDFAATRKMLIRK